MLVFFLSLGAPRTFLDCPALTTALDDDGDGDNDDCNRSGVEKNTTKRGRSSRRHKCTDANNVLMRSSDLPMGFCKVGQSVTRW